MKVTQQLLSAGAVVVRRDRYGTRILLLRYAETGEWRLPKGKLQEGESAADAAEREVLEETGLDLTVGRYLGVTHYYYLNSGGGGCVSKFVFFFEMESGEGRVELEDTFSEACWLPPDEACERLSFENEERMVRRATRW